MLYKVFVTSPESHTNQLIKAMAEAGAGEVGNYTHCAFVSKGYGTSLPKEGSKPFYGRVGKLNREPEDKIEMICPPKDLEKVIAAIKKVHPYETPTIDVLESKLYT